MSKMELTDRYLFKISKITSVKVFITNQNKSSYMHLLLKSDTSCQTHGMTQPPSINGAHVLALTENCFLI